MESERRTSVVDEARLKVTSIFTSTGGHAVLDHVADADEEILVALGYRQEFKRFVLLGDHDIQLVLIAQRPYNMGVLLSIILSTWTSTIYRLDPGLQPRLLWASRLGVGLDCRRRLDSVRRFGNG